jgi:hypothetical protein
LEELIKQDLKYRDKQLMRLKDEVLDLEDFNESVALNEFTLDDFRMDLSNYVEANREKLQDAPLACMAWCPVTPPAPNHASVKPGVIYCLKQQHKAAAREAVNPLNPYFLVYIQADGVVRYNFTAPSKYWKSSAPCARARPSPTQDLCKLFDAQTTTGRT